MTSTRSKLSLLAILIAAANLNSGNVAFAQSGADIPPSLVTPDKVDTRLGTLDFKDGVPSKATAEKLYDNLDFTYAYRAFMDNLRGVSIQGFRKGLQSVGVKDNEVIVFEQLMDAKSLFLTANADTIYVMGTSISARDLWCWRLRPSFLAPCRTPGSAG